MRNKNKSINYKWIMKYLMYFILFILMARSKVSIYIAPFALGLFLGLVFLRQNILMLSICYLISSFIFTLNYISIIISAIEIVIIFIIMFIYYKLKKEIKPICILLYSILIASICLLFSFKDIDLCIQNGIYIGVSVCFTFVVITAFNAIVIRGIAVKNTMDEKVCFLIMLLGVSLGLNGFNICGVDISKFIFTLAILVITYTFPFSVALSTSIVLGLSRLIYVGDTTYLVIFTIYTLLAYAFKNISKYVLPLVILMADVLFKIYLNIYETYTYLDLIPIITSGLIFISIPKSKYLKFREIFISPKEEVLVREIINRNREEMGIRLLEISDVFKEMQRVFFNMLKSGLTKDEIETLLVNECKSKVCNGCISKDDCYFRNKSSDEDLKVFICSSLARGKSTILDLPNSLANSCRRINELLSVANSLVLSYNEYVSLNTNMNNSRVLIGQQMGAVANILEELSKDCKINIKFNQKEENAIIDELLKSNIICNEVILYEMDREVKSLNLVIKKSTLDDKELVKVLSRYFKQKMMLVGKSFGDSNLWTSVHLKNMPTYDVVFGASGVKKWDSDKSGDTHSLIRVGENKFILTLCDGMGSGENAERVSSIAISLVENFYKAGFSEDIILTSVNKLLGIGGEETFAAIDISVIDLERGMLDSIKIGGVSSFIKREREVDLLQGSALPMGVLEEMKPSISKNILHDRDIVVMVTDGVVDAFFDEFNLRQFIYDLTEIDPTIIADSILAEAVKLSGSKPRDDMTVICARVVKQS